MKRPDPLIQTEGSEWLQRIVVMLANTGIQAAMSVRLASSLGILTTLQPRVFFAHSELKARVETSMIVDLGFSNRSRDRMEPENYANYVLSALRRCGLCYSARACARTKANCDIGRHSAPGRGRSRACTFNIK